MVDVVLIFFKKQMDVIPINGEQGWEIYSRFDCDEVQIIIIKLLWGGHLARQ
jgi:hypothetical protein